MATPGFGFEEKDSSDYMKPLSDWTYLARAFDTNIINMVSRIWGDVFITSSIATYATLTVTLPSFYAFAGGRFIGKATSTSYTLPGGLSNGTYKIYCTPTSYSDGSANSDMSQGVFSVTHTAGSIPSGSIWHCDVIITSGFITSLVDRRVIIGTIAAHDHTGGAQGPKISNNGISDTAEIAYSKLELANGIVNADVNTSAGIAYSKLNLASSIEHSDLNIATATATTTVTVADGTTVKETITHTDGGWGIPAIPIITGTTGDTVRAYLDYGSPITNTQFSLIVENVNGVGAIGSVDITWSRKGIVL
jgi:hypothetical protein